MTRHILLDACIPRKLAGELKAVKVTTVHEMGWSDLDDGNLLDVMASQFDAFVTVDKGIPEQRKLGHRDFAIFILRARSNRLDDLLPLIPKLLGLLEHTEAGQVYQITLSGGSS